MKLQFDANLQYQEQAVSAVVDLFRGQTPKQANFTVSNYSSQGTMFTDNGIGNKLELTEDAFELAGAVREAAQLYAENARDKHLEKRLQFEARRGIDPRKR